MRIIKCPKCKSALQVSDDVVNVICPKCGYSVSVHKRKNN